MRLKTKKKIKSSSLWSELTIFLEEIFPHIFVGIIVFMVFIISIDIYEYITTEIWWIHDSLNYAYTGLFLMCLILIATTINWEIFLKKKSFVSLILLFFPLILIFHKEYIPSHPLLSFLAAMLRVPYIINNYNSDMVLEGELDA